MFLSLVTFSFHGHAKAAAHYGMPFGAVSACWAYHRYGHFLEMLFRRRFRCPCSRCVDDLAGASRAQVTWTGGKVLTLVSLLLGIVVDPMESADDAMQMTILGVCVTIMLESALITV